MPTTRISEDDHRVLQTLAAQTGKQHQEILHEALDTYRRDRLLDNINSAFERLRANEKDWAQEKKERELWEATLSD
ncbi:MAG: toxin-antitoxin system protein [Gemmatimonadaceae bacterium]